MNTQTDAYYPGYEIDPGISSYWERRLETEFIGRPGQHLCEIGRPGTGKTQGLYYLVDKIMEAGREQILWFDIGKGDEILTLPHYFGPTTIFTPPGCEVAIQYRDPLDAFGRPYDIEFKTISRMADVWQNIQPGRINICSFDPFILDPGIILEQVSDLFERLIRLAFRRQVIRPLAIIYDEFHNVAPAHGYGFASTPKRPPSSAGRSTSSSATSETPVEEYRMIVTAHEWQQLYKGVRTAFEWVMIRRGAKFGGDEPKLSNIIPGGPMPHRAMLYCPPDSRPQRPLASLLRGRRPAGRVVYRGLLE